MGYNNWDRLKEFLEEYRYKHSREMDRNEDDDRYCVAISIDDLMEKMEEIEEENDG